MVEVKVLGNIYPSRGQNGNVYDSDYISPTINAGVGNKGRGIGSCNAPKIMEEVKVINPLKGQSDNGWHFEQQVYDANGITRAIKAGGGSGNIPKVIVEYEQNPNPPSDEEGVHRNPDGGYLTQVTPHRKLAEGECKREEQSARHSPATAREY